MHNKILKHLNNSPQQSFKAKEIAHVLQIPADQKKTFRRVLKQMSIENEILRLRGGRYTSVKNQVLIDGIFKMHYEGYGFVLSEEAGKPDVFIPARHVHDALPGDRVAVQVEEEDRLGRVSGKIVDVLERAQSQWVGKLEQRGKHYVVVNRDYSVEIEISVSSRNIKHAYLGQMVVVEITQFPGPGKRFEGELTRLLGEARSEEVELASILIRHHIPHDFPKAVLKEAEAIPDEIPESEYEGRLDLRDYPILTIDGVHAKDFDDAVCVKKIGEYLHLYVSIADVAHYVKRGSPLDQEAIRRGTSVYFPDFAIPMLPEKLSNGLCSLKPGEDRLTLTCEMRFDRAANLKEAWYYESVIKSQKRGIYEEVQNYFDTSTMLSTGSTPGIEDYLIPSIRENLKEMQTLSHGLMRERKKRGAIDFDLPEGMIVYNHTGEIETITQSVRFFSHMLIEEFMIAANHAVAHLFTELQIPIPYRIHDFPKKDKLEDFYQLLRNLGVKLNHAPPWRHPKDFAQFLETISDHPMESLIHQLLLRSMPQAVYSPKNVGHFGLSLKDYCHFTSPIRRYPDLLVHRQLKALLSHAPNKKLHFQFGQHHKGQLKKSKSFYTYQQIELLSQQSSKRERDAGDAEREMMDYKCALFMQNHVGEKFYGAIRRITKFGMFVELEPHFVEGLLHVSDMGDDYYIFDEKKFLLYGRRKKSKTFRIGDQLWVRVKDVSLEKRTIELEMG